MITTIIKKRSLIRMTSYYDRIRKSLEILIEEEIELFVKERRNNYMLYLDVLSFEASVSGAITSSTIENPVNLYPHTDQIQWGRLKAGCGHCLEEEAEQFYHENPKDFSVDFYEYFESLFDNCLESYKSTIVNDAKRFSEFLIEECSFEIVEKSNSQIDIILRIRDFFDFDLSEFEPGFSEALYEKSLQFSKIKDKDATNFFWEGKELNKTLEITISI